MLGSACFRLCARGSYSPATVALSHFHHSGPHPYSTQVICRHATSVNFSRHLSLPCQQATTLSTEGCALEVPGSVKRFCCHSSSCLLAGNEVSCATIWHGLLPSHHPSILDQNIVSPLNSSCTFPSFDPQLGSTSGSSLIFPAKDQGKTAADARVLPLKSGTVTTADRCTSSLSFPHGMVGGMRRFAVAAGLLDGSWNVAWDVRPARWLHGRHSAWLLFGVCACFSAAAGASVPDVLTSAPSNVEAITEQLGTAQAESDCGAMAVKTSHGKQVYTDYSVTGIPGDGRCLFRAVAHGACLRSGKPAPNEALQRELADDLRHKVVEELVMRREESEWFIEEDFDTYVKRMQDPHVWGGEPELLMASHVLKMPITVYIFDRSSGGLISIAEYGLEYDKENPIRVLYHGFGHYDAIQIPAGGTYSKL